MVVTLASPTYLSLAITAPGTGAEKLVLGEVLAVVAAPWRADKERLLAVWVRIRRAYWHFDRAPAWPPPMLS